jgi:hypothetical protein
VRRKEKLTLWPNCLPLPVSSQRATISLLPLIFNNLYKYTFWSMFRQGSDTATYIRLFIDDRASHCYNGLNEY